MNEDFLVDAVRAVQRRLQDLTSLYPTVHGEDAQILYSDSLASTQALASALGALMGEIDQLVKRHDDVIKQSLKQSEELLKGFQDQSRASSTADTDLAELHRTSAQLSLTAAQSSFRTASLSYDVAGHILAMVNISSLGILANIQASDCHYQNEAIKRFLELVKGLVMDAFVQSELFNKITECFSAMRDILIARVKDAQQADTIFTRERSFQELTHYAGLATEMLRLIIQHLNAESHRDNDITVSFSTAVDEWRKRLNAANDALGRNQSA